MSRANKQIQTKRKPAAMKLRPEATSRSAHSPGRRAYPKQNWIDIDAMQRWVVGLRSQKSTVLAVEEGLPIVAINRLRERLDLEKAVTLKLLGISAATMNRRERSDSKRLDPTESDRVIRYSRLLALAIALMEGDEDAANRWLRTPDDYLGRQTPLEHSRTETGFREVEQLINRIEHGVYS